MEEDPGGHKCTACPFVAKPHLDLFVLLISTPLNHKIFFEASLTDK